MSITKACRRSATEVNPSLSSPVGLGALKVPRASHSSCQRRSSSSASSAVYRNGNSAPSADGADGVDDAVEPPVGLASWALVTLDVLFSVRVLHVLHSRRGSIATGQASASAGSSSGASNGITGPGGPALC